MKREKLSNLINWFQQDTPRKPLIIRGARQVGKSTLVRLFAEAVGKRLVTVNLERHVEMDVVFASLDLQKILPALEALPGAGPIDDNVILFLDEIQATPHALAALRYFYEERPMLPVVAAGSLLEFVLADHSFSMPVGRVGFLQLDPMSFEEFLEALEEAVLLERLRGIRPDRDLDPVSHQRLTELFTIYSYVGGMPEAVAMWVKSKSPIRVREVHDALIETYKADFAKYGLRQDLTDLHTLFDRATRSIGRKVKYAALLPEEQSRFVRRLLDLLVAARLYYKVHHADCQGFPLRAGINDRVYKLLMLDVGIFNAVCRCEWKSLTENIKTSVAHRGALAEQLVGQELLASSIIGASDNLVYWLREGRGNNAETDYVVGVSGQIIPIEVKSGEAGSLKSLFVFAEAHHSLRVVRFDLGQPSIQRVSHAAREPRGSTVTVDLWSLPLYAAGQLGRILNDVPAKKLP